MKPWYCGKLKHYIHMDIVLSKSGHYQYQQRTKGRKKKKSKDDFSSIILIQRLLKSITEENILCIFWFLWGERVREEFIFKVYDHLIIWATFLKVFFFLFLSFLLLQKYWEDSLHTKTEQMSKKKKLEIK